MAFKIATWNVNSILARLPVALEVLKTLDADVVALQEIKCEDHRFPRMEIEELGYNVETHGQKSYNGVALLSKHRIEDVTRGCLWQILLQKSLWRWAWSAAEFS